MPNLSTVPEIRVRPTPNGHLRVSVFIFGKQVASVDSVVNKPQKTVADQLYGLAIAFKALGDAAKEKEL